MRSFIGIFFMVIITACGRGGSVQVSGRIETGNARDTSISFSVNGQMYDFKLDEKHSFSGKIHLEEGTYATVLHPYYMYIYLSPGEDLEINMVHNAGMPQFKGTLSAINNYLKEQGRNMTYYLAPEDYQQEEEAFVHRMQDILNMNILLLEAKNLGKEFTNQERERIRYRVAWLAIKYPQMRSASNAKTYTPGDVFNSFIAGFDLNNESLLSCQFYKQFLVEYFYYYRGKSASGRRLVNDILTNVSNLKVRDFLLSELVYAYFAENGLRDSDYLLSVCWNEVSDTSKLVKVRKLVDRWRKLSAGATAPDISLIDSSGKEVQLKDMQGKYLCIRVWKPHFDEKDEDQEQEAWHKLVKEYEGKNIRFLAFYYGENEFSHARKNPGEHFLLKKPYEFYTSYMISTVPRYVLINPDGRIIEVNAPKPTGSMKLLLQNMGL